MWPQAKERQGRPPPGAPEARVLPGASGGRLALSLGLRPWAPGPGTALPVALGHLACGDLAVAPESSCPRRYSLPSEVCGGGLVRSETRVTSSLPGSGTGPWPREESPHPPAVTLCPPETPAPLLLRFACSGCFLAMGCVSFCVRLLSPVRVSSGSFPLVAGPVSPF